MPSYFLTSLHFSLLVLAHLAGSAIEPRSCPLGKFCSIGANCNSSKSQCVETCPTTNNRFQQGNWSTGNCERGKPVAIHNNSRFTSQQYKSSRFLTDLFKHAYCACCCALHVVATLSLQSCSSLEVPIGPLLSQWIQLVTNYTAPVLSRFRPHSYSMYIHDNNYTICTMYNICFLSMRLSCE